MTTPQEEAELREQLSVILEGIDKDELESGRGWWETSTGAAFGAKKFEEIVTLIKARDEQREREIRIDELRSQIKLNDKRKKLVEVTYLDTVNSLLFDRIWELTSPQQQDKEEE